MMFLYFSRSSGLLYCYYDDEPWWPFSSIKTPYTSVLFECLCVSAITIEYLLLWSLGTKPFCPDVYIRPAVVMYLCLAPKRTNSPKSFVHLELYMKNNKKKYQQQKWRNKQDLKQQFTWWNNCSIYTYKKPFWISFHLIARSTIFSFYRFFIAIIWGIFVLVPIHVRYHGCIVDRLF